MTKLLLVFVTLIYIVGAGHSIGFADPLVYNGRQDLISGDSGNTQEASSPLVPVTYGTNYETQYSPYASFMQSPYTQGGLRQGYPQGSPAYPMPMVMPGQTPIQNPATATKNDPYQASEVSPYSRYSPYMEIIGEGSNYTLGIDDVVTIIVRNQPDFSGRFIVDPEGNIQYNFVGDIPAVGKNKEQLKAEIMQRLTRFVRYPEVAVMISEYRSKAVYVFGFINRPGKYAMKGDKITVKEAVVAAGLPREDGSLKRVYVIRPSNYTKDGKATKKKVNLKELIQKGNAAEDFILEPGDTIVVHQKHFDRFVNTFSRLVGPLFQAAAVYDLGWGAPAGGFFGGDE